MRLIDADALILWTDNYYVSEKFTVAHFANMVKDMPTIEERKTGEWIKEGSYINRQDERVEIMRCSLCGQKHYYVQGTTSLDDDTWFSFCPHCGADMRGGNR